jgi:uncharacterized protein DUF3303
MLFIVHFEVKPENRDKSFKRFEKVGELPSGNEHIGVWFAASQLEGWAIVKSENAVALGNYLHAWTDLNVNTVTPLLEPKELEEIFGK